MGKQYLRIFGNNFARVTEWNNALFGICRHYSLFYIRFKCTKLLGQTTSIYQKIYTDKTNKLTRHKKNISLNYCTNNIHKIHDL